LTETATSNQTVVEHIEPNAVCRSGWSWRWWLAVLVGLVVSVPLVYLLSLAALLPFYLGLFFFILFGLLIGAAVYRVASPARPYHGGSVLLGTTLLVVVCWTGSIVLEAERFPQQMAGEAIESARHLDGRTAQQFRDEVADSVRNFLSERYPPGGVLGYMRWSLTSSVLNKADIEGLRKTIKSSQSKHGWAIRVVLSIALLGFGIGSQTFSLRAPCTPREADGVDHTA